MPGKKKMTKDDEIMEKELEEPMPTKNAKSKGRAGPNNGPKKGKDDDMQEEESVESDMDGKDEEKNGEDAVGKASNKKAPKRGVASGSSDKQEDDVNEAKPKKVVKKVEVLPTRRGGDRAAKKAAVENLSDGKNLVKKGRGAAGKKVPAKVASKSRGRLPKSNKAALETEDSDETSENAKTAATVAVEH